MSAKNNHQISGDRLLFLDGLRGIAIMLVVLYHAYADWTQYLPYHQKYADVLLIRYGEYGVQLFFMISGFVIAMTLEKCESFRDFMLRRWLRLFPAMLIGSLLILATAPLFTARPFGAPLLQDVLPGILLIEPKILNWLFNLKLNSLEVPFWTLYVELKFYVLAGLLYFSFGINKMIYVITLMFFCYVVYALSSHLFPQELANQILSVLAFIEARHLGWFATGAMFYRYFRHKNAFNLCSAIIVGLFAARSINGVMSLNMIVTSLMVMVLAVAVYGDRVKKILENKCLIWLGFISYPLYLIHDSTLVSMTVQLHQAAAWVPMYLLPILPLLLLMLIAWAIAQYLEPNLRALIKHWLINKPIIDNDRPHDNTTFKT